MAATVPLAATGALTLGAGSAHAAANSAYVMCYFTESPTFLGANYGLHLAVSPDGLEWTPLNQNAPVATPTAGSLGLRDPFILRKQDGTFVVLATDLNGTDWSYVSQYIHVWDSTDLRAFTGYRRMKLHDLNTHAWAPESFWDAGRGQYGVIYSAVNDSGHNVIMVNYTSDFVTAGEPQVFFDPGYDVIDGDIAVGVNGVNYLYFKKNSTLVGARSTSLDPGSFTEFSTAVSHNGTEAPELVKSLASNGVWYLWGDTWDPNGVFYAWQTSSLAAGTWTAVDQKLYTQPLNSSTAASSRSPAPSTPTSLRSGALRPGTGSSPTTIRPVTSVTRTSSGGSTSTPSTRTPTRSGRWCRASPTRPGCPSSR